MRSEIVLVLLVFTTVRCQSPKQPKLEFGITYGHSASIEDYPCYCRIWMQRSNGATFFCGGTLIQPNQILTAAHCFIDAVKIYACCGSDSCQNIEGRCYHPEGTEGVYVHKGFVTAVTNGALYDDIAYIRTKGSFVSSTSNTCKIYVPEDTAAEQAIVASQAISVIGCGITETGKNLNSPHKYLP